MERGRELTQGHNIRHSPSPSPHPPFTSGISSSLTSSDPTFGHPSQSSPPPPPGGPFDLAAHSQQQQQVNLADHTFLQARVPSRSPSPSFAQRPQQGNPNLLGGDGN